MIIHLMDTLKKGYVINNTLDLSSRVMSLDAAKDILRHTATVSPRKVLRMSDSILTDLENDTEGNTLLAQTRNKGWVIQSSEYYDIQFRVTDSSTTASFKINATAYNDPDNVTVNVGSDGWCRYNIPDDVTLTSLVGAFNEKTNIDRIVLGGAIDTRNLTDMNRMCRYADNVKYLYVLCDTSNVTNFERMLQQRVAGDKLRDISLDVISNGANTSNMFIGATMLTSMNVNRISETLDLTESPIDLDSAKVILGALQTVTSETCIFSTTTQDLIAGDYEAKMLLANARLRGWNIPIRSTVTGTVTSGTSSVSIRINGTARSVTCTNGAFTYTTTDVITSLDNFIYNNNNLLSVDMHRMDLYSCTSITNAFNSSRNLASINASGLDTRNVTTFQAFAHYCTNSLNSPNLQNIDTSSATSLRRLFSSCQNMTTLPYLPEIPSDCDTSLMFDDCPRLVTINACGPISETVSFASSPLTIFSARVILRQLQTVTSETLTFSSTTLGYINNDPEAMILVGAARERGWNIPGASSLPGISGTVSSGSTFTFTLNSEAVTVPVSNGSWVYNIPSSTHVYNINFVNSTVLTSLDLSQLDTSEITNFSNMFEGCSNLTSLDLRTFDTSGAYYFNDMFNGCTKLTSVNLSGWDTSNSTHWMRMFKDCTSLRNIDISHFDATYTQNITGMFQGCTNITIAIANSNNAVDMRNITTYNNFIENIGTVTVRYSSNVRVYNSFIKSDFPRANWVDVG